MKFSLAGMVSAALTVALLSCSARVTTMAPVPCAAAPFVRHTPISAETLLAAWHEAQQRVAAGGLTLNAVAAQFHGAAPRVSLPDERALNVRPCGLVVVSPAEVPAAELNRVAHCTHCPYSDPTGVLHCAGSPTGYCKGFTDGYRRVNLPASDASAAAWEFSIVILHALGYDASGM